MNPTPRERAEATMDLLVVGRLHNISILADAFAECERDARADAAATIERVRELIPAWRKLELTLAGVNDRANVMARTFRAVANDLESALAPPREANAGGDGEPR